MATGRSRSGAETHKKHRLREADDDGTRYIARFSGLTTLSPRQMQQRVRMEQENKRQPGTTQTESRMGRVIRHAQHQLGIQGYNLEEWCILADPTIYPWFAIIQLNYFRLPESRRVEEEAKEEY